jgi:hypothetical protein
MKHQINPDQQASQNRDICRAVWHARSESYVMINIQGIKCCSWNFWVPRNNATPNRKVVTSWVLRALQYETCIFNPTLSESLWHSTTSFPTPAARYSLELLASLRRLVVLVALWTGKFGFLVDKISIRFGKYYTISRLTQYISSQTWEGLSGLCI